MRYGRVADWHGRDDDPRGPDRRILRFRWDRDFTPATPEYRARLRTLVRVSGALTIFDTLATAVAVGLLGVDEANTYLSNLQSHIGLAGMLAVRCAVGLTALGLVYYLAAHVAGRFERRGAMGAMWFVTVIFSLLAVYHVVGTVYVSTM